MNRDKKTLQLVKTSIFIAAVTVTTLVVQIPSPTQGYINLGDCFVLLSGWILGPVGGFLAGGLGSMLSDLLAGYSYFAPASLAVKGLGAVFAALIYAKLPKKTWSLVVSGAVGEVFIVLGYFGYTALLLGKGLAAAASIPGDLVQAIVGICLGTVLFHVVKRAKLTDTK